MRIRMRDDETGTLRRALALVAAVTLLLLPAACGENAPATDSGSAGPTESVPDEVPERLADEGDGTIVVDTPAPNTTVTSPVTISGDADVFEANVSISILGPDMEEIATDFATATCGTGCRGTFEKDVAFAVDSSQEGWIEVYESSAEDGSHQHVVLIPVILEP